MNASELNLATEKTASFGKIQAKIVLYQITSGVSTNFQVNFSADLTCGRCLEAFAREFKINYHLDYFEGKDPFAKNERIELKPMDIDRVFVPNSRIDLSIGLREAIMLALPISAVCSEHCLGLCPVCGKNLNRKKCGCKVARDNVFAPKQEKPEDNSAYHKKNHKKKISK